MTPIESFRNVKNEFPRKNHAKQKRNGQTGMDEKEQVATACNDFFITYVSPTFRQKQCNYSQPIM